MADHANVPELLSRAREKVAAQDDKSAAATLEEALVLAPRDADVVALLAQCRVRLGRYADARKLLLDFCTSHDPGAVTLRQIGGWFFGNGDYVASVAVFGRWCNVDPDSADALISLGSARQMLGQNTQAAAHYRQALTVDAGRADAWSNLGTVYQGEHDLAGAEEAYARALSLAPGNAEAIAGLASVFDLGGETERALALIDEHGDTADQNVELAILASKLKRRSGDPQRAADVVNNVLKLPNLSRAQQARLSFTLADALDAQDKTDEAFACYERANAQRGVRFDTSGHREFIDHIISVHPGGAQIPDQGSLAPAPLFIVGMPRSGTTLVEQMLSCHSAVHAAGERRALPATVAAITPRHERFGYPTAPQALDADTRALVASRYRQGLPDTDSARFVTDKLPGNFIYLGLIPLLFPNARVVHCQRDPLDVGLSLYCNDFAQASLPFAYSLTHIGEYYLHYRHIMAHWADINPVPMVNVRYEDLVREPREQIGRVLAFLDAPFEDQVLDFHTSRRVALTASNDQVRQPLYTSSVGRAERYTQHLAPLRAVLDGAGEAYGAKW